MLRSSHPYHGPHHTQPLEQTHTSRNPWAEQQGSSSASSAAGTGRHPAYPAPGPGPPPASEWLRPHTRRSHSHHSHSPYTPHYTLSHQAPLLNQLQAPVVQQAVPVSTHSSPCGSTAAGLDSCGGQCVACETFCYYCLQVVFIAGILTGTSLTIAGSVLRGNHRGSDLMVLVYIGVLLVLVCSLLLSVHCCVRRGVKARQRARTRRAAAVIPLQELGPPPAYLDMERRVYLTELPTRGQPLMQSVQTHWEQQPYQPLIHRPNVR